MRQFAWILLLLTVFFSFGCGSKPPAPPALDQQTRAKVAQEDAAVATQESQQSVPSPAAKK